MDAKDFYKKCNLKSNPFRSNPVVESDPRMSIWVGYEKEKNTLLKFLKRTRFDQVGNNNFIMIYGELGAGKSHALLWSKHHVTVEKGSDYNSLAFYIQTLKRDAGKITFAGAFRDDIVQKSKLVIDLNEYKQFLIENIIKYKASNQIAASESNDKVIEQIFGSNNLSNFAKKLYKCDSNERILDLILPSNLTDYQALQIFTTIVNLFIYSMNGDEQNHFKKSIYLLIDELDLLAYASAKEARETNELIRHLYDDCPNCFFLGLGFTSTSAELNILYDEYVLSRVTRQIILDFLNPEDAKTFAKEILNTARIDNKKNIDYYPFTEKAIHFVISQMVSITPRKIVNVMHQIIEEIRLLDFEVSSDKLITDSYLDENDIIEEILDTGF